MHQQWNGQFRKELPSFKRLTLVRWPHISAAVDHFVVVYIVDVILIVVAVQIWFICGQ